MKRKNLLFAVVLMMLGGMTAQAQKHQYYDTKHEVGIAIGGAANTEIIGGLAELTGIMVSTLATTVVTGGTMTGTSYSYGSKEYIPALSAEYYYHVSKVVGVGGFVALNGMSRDMYVKWTDNVNGTSHVTKTGTARIRNVSVIPTAKFDWLRRKSIGLYSKLGAGVTFMHESQKEEGEGGADYSDTSVCFNFQATLLGLEAGSPRFRGFVELGMGEQGLALAGLRYKF